MAFTITLGLSFLSSCNHDEGDFVTVLWYKEGSIRVDLADKLRHKNFDVISISRSGHIFITGRKSEQKRIADEVKMIILEPDRDKIHFPPEMPKGEAAK